jgi:hypothetical protein
LHLTADGEPPDSIHGRNNPSLTSGTAGRAGAQTSQGVVMQQSGSRLMASSNKVHEALSRFWCNLMVLAKETF